MTIHLGDEFGNEYNASNPVPTSIVGSLANAPTATIANGAALSSAVDLVNSTLVAISMPAAWTAASITFDVSNDGVTYGPLYYQGSEFTLTEASASRLITVDPLALMPWRYLKVRSGTSGTPVNQGQQAIVQLWTKPVA